MKRLILLLFLCLLTGFSGQFATTEDGKKVLLKDDGTWEYVVKEEPIKKDKYNFRKTTWGMTKEQVKKTEKGKVEIEKDNSLIYSGKVGGLECGIGYVFAEGKLVRTRYLIIEKHTNKNDYITDYKSLKEILTKKYGKPIEDKQYWKKDLYKNDYQDWGFAISLGHLTYFATWRTNKTDIVLGLYGDNYKINLGVEYESIQLKVLEEKAREKKALDEF